MQKDYVSATVASRLNLISDLNNVLLLEVNVSATIGLEFKIEELNETLTWNLVNNWNDFYLNDINVDNSTYPNIQVERLKAMITASFRSMSPNYRFFKIGLNLSDTSIYIFRYIENTGILIVGDEEPIIRRNLNEMKESELSKLQKKRFSFLA